MGLSEPLGTERTSRYGEVFLPLSTPEHLVFDVQPLAIVVKYFPPRKNEQLWGFMRNEQRKHDNTSVIKGIVRNNPKSMRMSLEYIKLEIEKRSKWRKSVITKQNHFVPKETFRYREVYFTRGWRVHLYIIGLASRPWTLWASDSTGDFLYKYRSYGYWKMTFWFFLFFIPCLSSIEVT